MTDVGMNDVRRMPPETRALLPCPFCGGAAREKSRWDERYEETFYFVECSCCCVSNLAVGFLGAKTAELAAWLWNRREAPAATSS